MENNETGFVYKKDALDNLTFYKDKYDAVEAAQIIWRDIKKEPPEEEDVYLVAWLPKYMIGKRKECFIVLGNYESGEWSVNMSEELKRRYNAPDDIELFAYMPLPRMYTLD